MADTPANGGILVGDMLIVFFCVVSSAAALGQVSAALPDMAKVFPLPFFRKNQRNFNFSNTGPCCCTFHFPCYRSKAPN